jgi:hypothetical protein
MSYDRSVPWRGLTNRKAPDQLVTSDFIKVAQLNASNTLPPIDFTSQDYEGIKKSLTDYLKAFYPLDYNNFVESDLGMMLVNTMAYMGTTLSLKADMLANENFLETARVPANVRKLLQLIGVDMRGPLAAKANAKLTLDSSPQGDFKITKEERNVTVISDRDGQPVSWVLYYYDHSTGEILLDGKSDLIIPHGDFDNGTSISNLILLEGFLKEEEGSFVDIDAVKYIYLKEAPVVEGSIQVSSSEGMWEEIDSLYLASGSDHKVFEKVYDDNYGVKLIFGDGIRGKPPISGDSYTVLYRTGGGFRGNIKNNFLNKNVKGIDLVTGSPLIKGNYVNTTISTGGQNAESVDHAKKYAPYLFRSQYRAVTGDDYTAISNAFQSSVGYGKCIAVNRQSGASSNIIDIYCIAVANEIHLERASLQYKQELIEYMNEFKMIAVEIVAIDALIRTLDLVITIMLKREDKPNEERIKVGVASKIKRLFHADNVDFGETLFLGDIVVKAMEEEGVTYTTVDNIKEDIFLMYNEIIQLNNIEINVEYV